MNDYEKYVTEVNNIFSLLEKLKNSWTNNDNLSSIEEINEFIPAQTVSADEFDQLLQSKPYFLH